LTLQQDCIIFEICQIVYYTNLSGAPALEGGLTLLEMAMESGHRGIRLSDGEAKLPQSRATVHRLLQTLVMRGYLNKRESDGRYLLGDKIKINQTMNFDPLSLGPISQSLLDECSSKYGNTCVLFYWVGREVWAVGKCCDDLGVNMQSVGERHEDMAYKPWGWIFLSEFCDRENLDPIKMAKSHNWAVPLKLCWMNAYRKNGFALDLEIHANRDVRRVAIPLWVKGHLMGALAMAGNRITLPNDELQDVGGSLKTWGDRVVDIWEKYLPESEIRDRYIQEKI
jgi:IclR family KDG regulon transcriptional repressor